MSCRLEFINKSDQSFYLLLIECFLSLDLWFDCLQVKLWEEAHFFKLWAKLPNYIFINLLAGDCRHSCLFYEQSISFRSNFNWRLDLRNNYLPSFHPLFYIDDRPRSRERDRWKYIFSAVSGLLLFIQVLADAIYGSLCEPFLSGRWISKQISKTIKC